MWVVLRYGLRVGIFGKGARGSSSTQRDSELPLLTVDEADYLRECAVWALAELGIGAELDGGFVVSADGGALSLDGLQRELRKVDQQQWPDRILALFRTAEALAQLGSAVGDVGFVSQGEVNPQRPESGLTLLHHDGAEELQRMIIEYFATEHGVRVRIADATVIVEEQFHGQDGVAYGLTNLERKVLATDRPRWWIVVAEHFASLIEGTPDSDDHELESRLVVRLTNPDYEGAATFGYAPYWIEPLVGALAIDRPDHVKCMLDGAVGALGDLEQAYRRAWANLRRELNGADLTFDRTTVNDDFWVDEVSGNYHLATAAFLLGEYLPSWYPGTDLSGGVVFGIPNRYSMFLRPISARGIAPANLAAVADVVDIGWRTGVSPVSPHVYFWHPMPDTRGERSGPWDIDEPEWNSEIGPGLFHTYSSRAGRVMQLTDWDENGDLKIVTWPRIVTFG
jgi:hypothetical protein